MKKNPLNIGLAIVAVAAFTINLTAQTEKAVDVEQSQITWKGYKVTGSHEGTIAVKEGTLTFNGDQLSGGEFTIDMTTINSTDLEGEYKQKLDGHLSSDDFFGVEEHPTAHLMINEVTSTGKNSYEAKGDITIKGVTKPVTFEISIYGSQALATIKLDRTEFGLRYGSGSFFDNLGDKVIYDEFDVVADLQF